MGNIALLFLEWLYKFFLVRTHGVDLHEILTENLTL
jgi:hypothetical protein